MAMTFEILPAIDLRGGCVVRLERGDFTRETSYSEDPVATAVLFAGAGARWLHVVDLEARGRDSCRYARHRTARGGGGRSGRGFVDRRRSP